MGFFENPPERFADIASQAQCASLLGFFLVFYLLFISRPYYAYVELSEDELKFKKRWQTTAIINKQSIQQVTHNQFSYLIFQLPDKKYTFSLAPLPARERARLEGCLVDWLPSEFSKKLYGLSTNIEKEPPDLTQPITIQHRLSRISRQSISMNKDGFTYRSFLGRSYYMQWDKIEFVNFSMRSIDIYVDGRYTAVYLSGFPEKELAPFLKTFFHQLRYKKILYS
ncbi:MAG: hypothetical protein AAF490_26535 [Chloroflexota bacterium]